MSIKEYAADCIRIARSNPMIEGEAGIFKIHNEADKKIYIQAFKEAFHIGPGEYK